MINEENIESNPGARSPQNTNPISPQHDDPARQAQKEEVEIVPLEIETAASRIAKSKTKDPQFSDNLRWVRNTQQNRQILTDFVIKKVIIRKVILGTNCSYLPCCNVFSMYKPKGKGHKDVRWNPLLFLLEPLERSKVNNKKKKLKLQNSSLSKPEFKKFATRQLMVFLQTECELSKLKKLVEDLPKMDGCFHLPFMSHHFDENCPGQSLILKSGAPLDFKVDLVAPPPDLVDEEEPAQSRNQSKGKKKNKKKRENKQGRVKKNLAREEKQIHELPDRQLIQGGILKPSENLVQQDQVSVGSEEKALVQLGDGLLEVGDNQLNQLSDEEINDRIAKLSILKHQKELLIQKKKEKLKSLKVCRDNQAEEVAGIEEESRRIKALL